jgi:hypothetical protein
MTRLEAVARALWRDRYGHDPVADESIHDALSEARAAIEALRDAGHIAEVWDDDFGVIANWNAALDAILSERPDGA